MTNKGREDTSFFDDSARPRVVTWLTITAPHFKTCVAMQDGVVAEAAPILKYMTGWDEGALYEYCSQKEWDVD